MTVREQLKQLLANTPYYENDCYLYKYTDDKRKEYLNDAIADHLLSNGVIVPPCKIGDVVYIIDNKRPCYACTFRSDFCYIVCPEEVIKKATIVKILITRHMTIEILVRVPGTEYMLPYALYYSSTDFDKTIFFSEEEAEKALKECKKNDR